MIRPLLSKGRCPHSSARGSALTESRRTWGQRTTRYLLTSLVAWFSVSLVGCGGDNSTPEVPEEVKEKQQVVQDKMKEFMQQKVKPKGARR